MAGAWTNGGDAGIGWISSNSCEIYLIRSPKDVLAGLVPATHANMPQPDSELKRTDTPNNIRKMFMRHVGGRE